jgi:acyl carrier protein
MSFDSKKELLDNITEIFREEMDSPQLVLTIGDTKDSVEGWDSLAHVRIVSAVEAKFGFQFEVAEIEEVTSVACLINSIERHMSHP